jgi:hypothetical protein
MRFGGLSAPIQINWTVFDGFLGFVLVVFFGFIVVQVSVLKNKISSGPRLRENASTILLLSQVALHVVCDWRRSEISVNKRLGQISMVM